MSGTFMLRASFFFRLLCRCRVSAYIGTLILLCGVAEAATTNGCGTWPLWQTFKAAHLSPEGRVIDTGQSHLPTVSEGQAYGMFFALVAGDPESFDAMVRWTRDNLSGGDLAQRLPGWHWGRAGNGSWQLLDSNNAGDADLWMAYTLLEAGRLWRREDYHHLGRKMARRLLDTGTADLPGLGRSLLPGLTGFELGGSRWRLNPSYVPMPLMRRMAGLFPQTEWPSMVVPALRLHLESAPFGHAPDWVVWDAAKGWQPDTATGAHGSYDAIRVYLWAGMSGRDVDFSHLAQGLRPWLDWVARHGHTPERLDTQVNPSHAGAIPAGPPGFDAVAAVFADRLGYPKLTTQLRARAEQAAQAGSLGYYSHALSLFSLGWLEGRFLFESGGGLVVPRKRGCKPMHQ